VCFVLRKFVNCELSQYSLHILHRRQEMDESGYAQSQGMTLLNRVVEETGPLFTIVFGDGIERG
jgi:hypothetical protein